ncbi:8169_t:CDS:2, partial [Rhizophagus irregularis]
WLDGKTKRITSRRLDISYDSNIHARDSLSITKRGNRHMYHRSLSNFKYDLSPNLRIQKQQEIRFKRTCRRVFNKMRLPSNRKAKNQDYLAIARKYRFLFLKSQYVKVPVRHLLYKHSNKIPNADDYPFLVPFFAMDANHKKQIMTKLSHVPTAPLAPPADYNPIPDMFIPSKYHDIIPKDPIYVNDRYVIPGSWKYIPRRPIYRSQVVGNYVLTHIVEKAQIKSLEKLKAIALRKESAYHGTTPKHYYSRINTIKSLTEASDNFHTRIPNYLVKRKENHDHGSSNATLDKYLTKFLKNNRLRTQGAMRFPTHIVATVSDDTAEFEYCLNKRDNAHNDYHYLPFLDHKMKRLHPTPAITDDSLAPGPSNSKNV